MPSFDLSYTYDGLGNRLSRTDHLTSEVTSYLYDSANRLETETVGSDVTTYSYDAAGNRTRKDAPASLTDYTWDAKNRLTKVELPSEDVDFQYNAVGQRVQKKTASETKNFIYDFEHLLQEADASDESTRLYTFTEEGPDGSPYGDLISEYGDGEGSSYHMYDAQWSTDALVDEMDTVTDRYKFTAFGVQNQHTGMSNSPFTFVGKQAYYDDPELELYYLGSGNRRGAGRSYDAQTGRFISQDPLGFSAGDENLYRYVKNNPVNVIDPSGHDALSCPGAGNDCNVVDGKMTDIGGEMYVRFNRPDCPNGNILVGSIGKADYLERTFEFPSTVPSNVPGFEGCNCSATLADVGIWLDDFRSTQVGSDEGPFCSKSAEGKYEYVLRYLSDKCNGIMVNPAERNQTVFNAFVEGAASELRERACAAIDIVLPGLCDLVESLWGNCSDAVESLKELAKLALGIGGSEVLDALTTVAQGATQGFINFLDPEKIWESLASGFEAIFGNIPQALVSLIQGNVLGIVEALGFGASKIGDWISTGATAIFKGSGWERFITFATEFTNSVFSIGLVETVQKLGGDVFEMVAEIADDPSQYFLGLLNDLKDKIDEGIIAIVNGFKTMLITAFAGGAATLIAFLNAITQACLALKQLIDAVVEAINAVRNNEGIERVATIFENFLKTALPLLVIRLATGIFRPLVNAFRCAVQRARNKIEDFIKNLLKRVLCFLKRKFGKSGNSQDPKVGESCPVKFWGADGPPGGNPTAKSSPSLPDSPCTPTLTQSTFTWSCSSSGSCFVAGTQVHTPNGLRSIDSLELGQRVTTLTDDEKAWFEPASESKITPETHRIICLHLDHGQGTAVEISLLRSIDWIEDYGAHVGGSVFLDMPEMGVEGLTEVLGIEPCPPHEEGDGRLVTGTFKHTSGEVYDPKLESESEPIGVTATHPFWSVDRNAWVSAIDLEIGETLKTLAGTTIVESRSKREEPETVYNIEVEGEHCYRVGESGVLVHNASFEEEVLQAIQDNYPEILTVDCWTVVSIEGPNETTWKSNPDPNLPSGVKFVRYYVRVIDESNDQETIYSVNYAPESGNFGTIKLSSEQP